MWEIQFHISDLSILRGYGIFDYLRTENKQPFLLERYVERFFRSAALLNLTVPLSKTELAEVVSELIKRNPAKDYGIRFVLTGGEAEDSFSPTSPNLSVLIEDMPTLPESYYTEGVKAMTQTYLRDIPEAKTLYYANAVKQAAQLKKNKLTEIIYCYNQCVLEATRCNVFIIKDKIISTANQNILRGVTREFVIETAREQYEVQERPILLNELYTADEVFLTSSNKKVLPVVEIDGVPVRGGKVGEVCQHLITLLSQAAAKVNGSKNFT